MSGAKSDSSWSPFSDDASEDTGYAWGESIAAKSSWPGDAWAGRVRHTLLSPDESTGGQSMRGRNSITAAWGRAAVPGNNVSFLGCHPAVAQEQQSQRNTPDLLAAIVDGALQAASAPGMLSVSAAGPQRISILHSTPSHPARAASSMLQGPSLLDLQPASAWQVDSQQQVPAWWPASP